MKNKKDFLASIENFFETFQKIQNNYKKQKNASELLNALDELASRYREYFGIGDLFVSFGETLIESGDYDAGIKVIKLANEKFTQIANVTVSNIRLAEYEFEHGNLEEGKRLLLAICNKIDNYEESLKWDGLSDLWEKYKHFIEDELSAASQCNAQTPISPDECTHTIDEILNSPDGELLDLMSEHLGEICANGARLELLSKEELNVYVIDEFISNINSDGLDHYFYHYGTHFPLLSQAITEIDLKEAGALLKRLNKKLKNPTKETSEEQWQDIIDEMEDKGKDFEAEETFYYEKVEAKLFIKLQNYILNNSKCFK